jgi:hypothetical protein
VPSPQTLLPWLLGGTVALGGILQGLHWRSAANSTGVAELEQQLLIATEENALLKRENQALRSLAQGGGEVPAPRELIERLEKEFGLRFLSSPVVHRIASEELRDRVAAALESRFGPSGIDDRNDAYRKIGWLRPDDDLLAQLTAVRAIGARAWFDDVTGEAWVTDRFDSENIPDQAALVRILTRILLHQNFPPPPAYPGDDAARAREAMHQGAAAGAEARFFAANARAIGFVPMTENTEAGLLLASLPEFMQSLITFPIIEGKGLADTLHVQGNETFQAAFRNPPQTTRAILLPAEPPAAPPALDGLPDTPEEPYLSESAGQLGLRLWLEPMGDLALASEIASFWKNDRYLLIPDGEASSAVVWDIELGASAPADQLQAAALDRIAAMAGLATPAVLGQTHITAEKRHLRLTRPSPTRVRFINTHTPALATSLGGN